MKNLLCETNKISFMTMISLPIQKLDFLFFPVAFTILLVGLCVRFTKLTTFSY